MLMSVGTVALLSLTTVQWLWLYGTALFVALAAGWGWNTLLMLGVMALPDHSVGEAGGFALTAGAIGAAVGPLVFGLLAGVGGYNLAWLSGGLMMLSATVMVHRAHVHATLSHAD